MPATPTIDAEAALLATVQPREFDSYPSPDGAWRVDIVIYDCTLVDPEMEGGNSLEQLFLISTGDGSRSLIDTQFLNCGGLGAAGFEGLFWTSDGAYFYYTGARYGVPDGCGYWVRPMRRLSIVHRTVEAVGGGPRSPDGSLIATWLGDELVIWELEGPRIAAVAHPIAGAIPGPIAWSPDGLSVAYLLSDGYCPLGPTYLVRLQLGDLIPEVVLSSGDFSFAGLEWDLPNRILLTDDEGGRWSFNLVQKQLRLYAE